MPLLLFSELEMTVKCTIIILIVCNSIFSVLGGICIIIGVWLKLNTSNLTTTLGYVASRLYSRDPFDIPTFLTYSSILIIITGVCVIAIALLGFGGALLRRTSYLYAYAVIVFGVVLLQIGLGIMIAVHKERFVERSRYAMSQSHRKNYRGPGAQGDTRDYSNSVDFLQVKFECCGVESGNDYNFNEWRREYEMPDTGTPAVAKIPYTCCKLSSLPVSLTVNNVSEVRKLLADRTCPVKPTAANSNAAEGCFDVIAKVLSTSSQMLLGVFFGMGFLNLCGLVTAIIMAVRLHRFDHIISNW